MDRVALDRWITGNWGEDSVSPECPDDCEFWEDGPDSSECPFDSRQECIENDRAEAEEMRRDMLEDR